MPGKYCCEKMNVRMTFVFEKNRFSAGAGVRSCERRPECSAVVWTVSAWPAHRCVCFSCCGVFLSVCVWTVDHVKSSPFHCLFFFFVFCCRAVQRLLRLTVLPCCLSCARCFSFPCFSFVLFVKVLFSSSTKKKGKNNMRLSSALVVAVVLFLACLTRGLEAASAPSAAASLSVSSSTQTAPPPSQAASLSSTTAVRQKKWLPLSQLRQPASATGNSDEFTVSYIYNGHRVRTTGLVSRPARASRRGIVHSYFSKGIDSSST